MSAGFQPILWNRQKKNYDTIFVSIILFYLVVYFAINTFLYPTLTFETILIRSFGTLSMIMLHVILSIGPLARLNKKYLVLLYNRRHLGVTMFLTASIHALFSIFQFHANGNTNPILSVFTSNLHYDSFIYFPFQTLGFVAYIILMLMAFTSHDFWLSVLSPRIWKTLHLLVYLAYFLLILHVLLGVVQLENSPIYFVMLLLGVLWLTCLHLYAGYREYKFDRKKSQEKDGWVRVCAIAEMEENKAKMINANGERIAIFRYGNKVSAVHNVCKHQNGPLGEGKIVDGCITCPWHGYQYGPADGCAPAPFTEKLATYHVSILADEVWINPNPLPEGTYVEPAIINMATNDAGSQTPFYIGWQPKAGKWLKKFALQISLIIASITILCAVLISYNQRHIQQSYFSFDVPPKYEGELVQNPFPALRTANGKDIYGNPIVKTYPLVNAWKLGADNVVADFIRRHGKNPYVQIEGATISSDGIELIQLNNGALSISCGKLHTETGSDTICCQPKYKSAADSIQLKNGNVPIQMGYPAFDISTPQTKDMGEVELTGEIIDPKCYFGAMNPGMGKPHRSCAIRCIEGGIMPMFVWKGTDGKKNYAVLLGENGQPLNKVIAYAVAEPVRVKGKLISVDDWKVLQVMIPNGLKRLIIE